MDHLGRLPAGHGISRIGRRTGSDPNQRRSPESGRFDRVGPLHHHPRGVGEGLYERWVGAHPPVQA